MRTYGQFCPVARASELLAERWTPIIVRNLLNGCRTFSEIRQGAPGIPTALLTSRLSSLERHGIIERERAPSGRGWIYRLTEQGQDLKAVCDAMGQWGARWLEIEPRHMDPAYVLWATTKLVLLLRKPHPELCTRGTGYVEDIIARTDAACLIDMHLKRTSYREALRNGRLSLDGPPQLTGAFMTWIRPSPYADIAAAPSARPSPRPYNDWVR